METLISLSIVSLMGICIIFSILICMQSFRKSKEKLLLANGLLKTDTQIREVCKKVKIPYWIHKTDFDYTSTSISLDWIDGINKPQTFFFDNIIINKVEWIQKQNKAPIGLRIIYIFENNEHNISCLFSTFPYSDIEI